jgi:hypothetical protein
VELDVNPNDVIAVLRQQLADATFHVTLLMLELAKFHEAVKDGDTSVDV